MPTKSLLAAVVGLLTVAAGAALPASATATPRTSPVQFAVLERSCAAPQPGHKACFAMRLMRVDQATPGAKPMAVVPSVARGPAGGYAPSALATAYGFDPAAALAKPQTVAIVDAHNDPYARADLNAFDAFYGLPPETNATFQKVNQSGQASPVPTLDRGWAREIALDVQAVRGACNHCKILLVEANTSSAADLATAVRTSAGLGATEISNSYGGPERATESPAIRKSYDQPGIVVTASTGDDGWFSWDFANGGGRSANKTNTPAAYPTVVAVTGTKLVLNANGTRHAETVWNENGLDNIVGGFRQHRAMGASGGGCSTLYNAPTWQSAVPGYPKMGCQSGKRVAGDVAADADPFTGFDVHNFYDGGWITIGGTSLSSPLIAAMWALAGGAGSERYPAKSLYDRMHFVPGTASDVTVGGNSWCAGDDKTHCTAVLINHVPSSNGNPNNLAVNGHPAGLLDCGYRFSGAVGTLADDKQCYARVGYDGVSGVGAPNNLTLFEPTRITLRIVAPSPVQLNTSQEWTVSELVDGISGATISSYLWTWGDGSTPDLVQNLPVSHTYTQAGTHRVTVAVTDNHGQQDVFGKTITVG